MHVTGTSGFAKVIVKIMLAFFTCIWDTM